MSVIELQGYKITLPDAPKEKELIFGWDRPKAEQFWERPYTLTDEQFAALPKWKQDETWRTEVERCVLGHWFMNNGKPFYLTGDNYFFLTHWTINGKYPQFIINQANHFYFEEMCWDDPHCFGSLILKPRREGVTQRALSRMVNKVIRASDAHGGIQSKTSEDAKKVNFGNLVKSFRRIPKWMQPQLSGMTDPKAELRFSEPSKRASKATSTQISDAVYLESFIDHKSTDSAGYDGERMYFYIGDEYSKWIESSAYDAWNIVKLTLVEGNSFDLCGKAMILSTIADKDENASRRAAEEYKLLWKESDPNKRTANGHTVSGLYRWFIPAWASMLGKDPINGKNLVNKYGEVNTERAKELLLNERTEAKDNRQRASLIKKKPFNVEEALNFGGAGSVFDAVRLGLRKQELENFAPSPTRPIKTRIGKLEWFNNERLTRVNFIDDPNGHWEIAYMPSVAGDDAANKMQRDGTIVKPLSTSQFVIGMDSYDFDDRDGGDYSKGCLLVYLKHNFYNDQLSNIFCAKLLHRFPTSEALYEEAVKASFFFGAKINLERNTIGFLKWMKAKGMAHFIMRRPESTKGTDYKDADSDYGTPTTVQTVKLGCELIENYLAEPDPVHNENTKDNLKHFWFEDGVTQLLEYTDKEKTRFDFVSAMIMVMIAAQSVKQTKPDTQYEQKRNRGIIDTLYPTYKKPNPFFV